MQSDVQSPALDTRHENLSGPSISRNCAKPWFDPEIAQFLDAVTRTPPSSNLTEARMCGVLESLARESSRRGGQVMAVPSPRMPRG